MHTRTHSASLRLSLSFHPCVRAWRTRFADDNVNERDAVRVAALQTWRVLLETLGPDLRLVRLALCAPCASALVCACFGGGADPRIRVCVCVFA
jgi:hypothetical protein